MTKTNLIATDIATTAGAISYWRIASDTNLSKLTEAWLQEGLAGDMLPKPPTNEVAAGRAVTSMADKRVLVRPLARRGAWGIVHETAEERQGLPPKLSHETVVHVFFRDGMPVVEQANGTYAQMESYSKDIAAAYSDARDTLAHHDVSSWLLKIAYDKLKAISLRDSGGVYFIPRDSVETWNKIATAVEKSGSSIFRIPAMRTDEAVAAITDAITQEAAAITQTMEDELMKTGDEALGKRALQTRVKEAGALLDKLATYEELIGKQLEIRERVKLLSANATAMVLTAETEVA